MSFPKPTPEVLEQLKARYGDVLVVEFGELGYFTLHVWSKAMYSDYVDAAARDRPNATQRFAARSVLTPTPSEYAVARGRRPQLPGTIVGVLCETAGIPRAEGSLADTWDERLIESTPPASLERAGLAPEKADELQRTIAGRDLTLVSVSDRTGKVFFGGVLAAPTEVESGMVSDLKKRKRGLQDGMKSIVESCLVWCQGPFGETVERYPGIVSVLMSIIADQLEVIDTEIFRP